MTQSMSNWMSSSDTVSEEQTRPDYAITPTARQNESLIPSYRPDSRDLELQERAPENYELGGRTNRMGSLFESANTHKTIKDYASQLAMQLMDRAIRLSPTDLIGVASFVNLDSSLNNTNPIGNQLSEYFIGEVQHFGLSVVDFKLANAVSVGSHGDFVLSRDAKKLADEMAMDHVLTGTMIYRSQGISVNARIVEIGTRRVVATANVMIPDFIVAEINPYLSAY